MASQHETFTLTVEAELDQALREIKRLERELKELKRSGNNEIKVDVDAGEATSTIQDLLDDVDKLSSKDAIIELALARNDIAQQVADIAEQVAELDTADAEIDIKMAEGDQLLGDIEQIDAKLRELGADKPEIQLELANGGQVIGDLEQVEGKVQEIDGAKAEVQVTADTSQLEEGLGRTRTGTDEVKDSARGAHSALANMIGNSAQDLGAMGGVAQSAGVALGQMAEYASDATLAGESLASSLGSMAMVAGPIAAVSIGVGLITSSMAKSKANAEELDATMTRFTDGMLETVGAAKQLDDALTAAFDVGQADAMAIVAREFQDAIDPKKVNDYQQALSQLNITNEQYVQGLVDSGGTFSSYVQSLAEQSGATEDVAKQIAAAVDEGDNWRDIVERVRGPAQDWINQNKDLVLGLEAVDDQIGAMSTNDLAKNYLLAQRGVESETKAVDEAIATTDNYGDALVRYLELKQQQIAVDSQARAGLAAQVTMWNSITQATDEATAAAREAHDAQMEAVDAKVLDDQKTMWEASAQFQQDAADAAVQAAADQAAAQAEARRQLADNIVSLQQTAIEYDHAAERANSFAAALDAVNANSEISHSQQIIAASDAVSAFGDALGAAKDAGIVFAGTDFIPDTWAEVRNMPDDLKPLVDAFGTMRDQIQTELTGAFDVGGMPAFNEHLQTIRQSVIEELRGAGIEGGTAFQDAMSALGLDQKTIDILIKTTGDEAAKAKIDTLLGAISGIPPEVVLAVTAKADQDPQAALQYLIDWFAGQGITVPASMLVDVTDGEDQIAEVTDQDWQTEVGISSNADDVQGDIDTATANRTTTVFVPKSDSLGQMQTLIDHVARARTVALNTKADNAGAIGRIIDHVARRRTAYITAQALTAAAEYELNQTARHRTSTVTQQVNVHTTHTSSGGGGATASPNAAPAAAATAAAAAPAVYSANVTVNAAVIGNRYDVMRAVSTATRQSIRIAGRRQAILTGSRR